MDQVEPIFESQSGPAEALKRVVKNAGSARKAGDWAGVSGEAVSKRLRKKQAAAEGWVLAFERESGISRHELRPDIYPVDDHAPGLADPTPADPSVPAAGPHLGEPVR